MKVQQYLPVASWFVGCVVISCLVHLAAPAAGIFGHLLTAVTSGIVGMIVLARHVNLYGPPSGNLPQHHIHHHHECGIVGGPDDDDGFDGWMQDADKPRPPYPFPPSRN